MSEGTLVSHNYILTVGAYTIESCSTIENKELEDGTEVASLTRKTIPSQWNEKGAAHIIKNHSFKNPNGTRAEVNAIPYKQWYRDEIEATELAIEIVEKLSK